MTDEKQLLKKIGLKICRDLYELDKPVEWLSFETGLARSTLREIIAGRSNVRVLTLSSIAKALKYKSITEFLNKL